MISKLYTNLLPIDGVTTFPTVNIDQHSAHPDAERITIDLEGEATDPLSSGAIYLGSQVAVDHAFEVFFKFRTGCPNAMLGWYWFPPVARRADVEPARHFAPLVDMANFVAPSLYTLNPRDNACFRRAQWWDKAMKAHEFPDLPRIGYVCPRNLDGTRANAEQFRSQVNAAKRIGCEAVYVWSGVPHVVWTAKLPDPLNKEQSDLRSGAWTRLVNDYGFRLKDSFTNNDVDREYARYSRRILEQFASYV